MVYFLCKAYDSDRQNCYFAQSLPVRGAWVEMRRPRVRASGKTASLPVRGAWVEIFLLFASRQLKPSLPVRGAWVEIFLSEWQALDAAVAPRAGSVG